MAAEPSDRAVVEAVLAGDRDAYATLVRRYQHRLYAVLFHLTGSRDDAEDLTQEALYRAYFALPGYKAEYEFSAWLFCIARNLSFNFRRRQQREEAYADPEDAADGPLAAAADETDVAAVAERRALARELWRAVGTLPEHWRQVLLLRHLGELSYREICQVTGLPEGTVKSRLARARRSLAEILRRSSPVT